MPRECTCAVISSAVCSGVLFSRHAFVMSRIHEHVIHIDHVCYTCVLHLRCALLQPYTPSVTRVLSAHSHGAVDFSRVPQLTLTPTHPH